MENNNDNKVLNVPPLRFPEFSGEWESVILKDIADFQKERISSELLDERTYISTENILQNFEGVQSANSIPANTNVIEYKESDILLSNIRPYLKKVWFADRTGGCSADVFVLRSRSCEPKYLYYVIASDKFINYIMSGAKGVKMPRGDKKQMECFTFSIPAIAEQKKISRLLHLLDERITTQNKIIEDLKKLKSAITDLLFHSIADAHTIRLGEIAHITNGAGDVQDANTEHQEDWYPFFDRSEELKWFPTYSFDKEAVIYAGEGQSFYPRYYNGKFALHQRCYAITDFASCIIPKYCYHFMNTLNSYFVRNSVGSTVPSLRMDIFQKVEIRLPPIPKQQHICKIIDAFYTKLEVEQRGISILQELKQFLLSQMFI